MARTDHPSYYVDDDPRAGRPLDDTAWSGPLFPVGSLVTVTPSGSAPRGGIVAGAVGPDVLVEVAGIVMRFPVTAVRLDATPAPTGAGVAYLAGYRDGAADVLADMEQLQAAELERMAELERRDRWARVTAALDAGETPESAREQLR